MSSVNIVKENDKVCRIIVIKLPKLLFDIKCSCGILFLSTK